MNPDIRPAKINLMASMLGAVTPNWRAVFLEGKNGKLVATFVLAVDSADDREEIADVEFEFCALQPEDEVMTNVVINGGPISSIANTRHLLFARKE